MDRTSSNMIKATSVCFDKSCSFLIPCYFPSISGIKTNLSPVEYLRVLTALQHPCFLISAYDIYCSRESIQQEMICLIEEAKNDGIAILVDSGNYESYWRQDTSWTVDKFLSVLKNFDSIPAFSFDIQNPDVQNSQLVNQIHSQVLSERSINPNIIPIIHANGTDIEEISIEIAQLLSPKMIAIPERLLGDGIIQRAKTISHIRRGLNRTGAYTPIHLLGTGNPLSILLFVLCGADSFDGLEWCQTTVEHSTALLYHFQQREFFGCQNKFCAMPDFPYSQATLAHNLLFYKDWMNRVRESSSEGTTLDMAKEYFSKNFLSNLDGYLDL